jgi:hypothetical protein
MTIAQLHNGKANFFRKVKEKKNGIKVVEILISNKLIKLAEESTLIMHSTKFQNITIHNFIISIKWTSI